MLPAISIRLHNAQYLDSLVRLESQTLAASAVSSTAPGVATSTLVAAASTLITSATLVAATTALVAASALVASS